MHIAINIVVIIICLCLFYQDFKDKEISLFLLITLSVFIFLSSFFLSPGSFQIENMFMNIFFVLLIHLLLTVYVSIRELKLINILDGYVGVGDLFLLLAITPALSFPAFILFATTGYIIALLVYVLFFVLMKKQSYVLIPLAGTHAGVFSVLIFLQLLFGENWLQDSDLILPHASRLIFYF